MKRNTDGSRKAHNLSQPLHRDLSLYALAAGAAGVSALALAPPADAQIIYTPAHITLAGDGRLSLDLNQDGVADVTLREFPCDPSSAVSGHELQAVPQPDGGGVRKRMDFVGDLALKAGQKVGPGSSFYGKAAIMVDWTSNGIYYYGPWAYDKNRYLGLRFLIDGETHYGWARLNVSYDLADREIIALVTGYAYQTQANTSILAGDEGNSGGNGAVQRVPSAEEKVPATLGLLALGADGIARRVNPPLQPCPR